MQNYGGPPGGGWPQQGGGQQPQHPQQPHPQVAMALAGPQGMSAPPATVRGVPLEPGERVIFYHHDDMLGQRILLIVVGIIMLVGVIGIFLLWAGLSRSNAEAHVITTRRLITIDGKRRAKFIHYQNIKKIVRVIRAGDPSFVNLFDGWDREIVSFHVRCTPNPTQTADLIAACVNDPASAERAPTVPYDP